MPFRAQDIKRAMDVMLAAAGILFFSPLLLITALSIWRQMGTPVLFRQIRAGLHGKPFMMYKFRTMMDLRDDEGELLPDERRLTPAGNILRRTSLDELPELFNVLKGDMSLVGPRPLLTEYLEHYSAEQARRHEVRPGITGWAQINGRNAISWEEKFTLDVWYVDHCSPVLDARILLLTLVNVLLRKGISADGHATMPLFRGSQNRERSENL